MNPNDASEEFLARWSDIFLVARWTMTTAIRVTLKESSTQITRLIGRFHTILYN